MLKADDESVTSDVWISDSKVKWLNGNWASAAADAEASHRMEPWDTSDMDGQLARVRERARTS